MKKKTKSFEFKFKYILSSYFPLTRETTLAFPITREKNVKKAEFSTCTRRVIERLRYIKLNCKKKWMNQEIWTLT